MPATFYILFALMVSFVFSAAKVNACAFGGSALTWPGGNVYYSFSNNVSTAKQKAFLDAAGEWATFANLHFIQRSTQTNYLLVYEDPSIQGGAADGLHELSRLFHNLPHLFPLPKERTSPCSLLDNSNRMNQSSR